jgi:hypothetical protein
LNSTFELIIVRTKLCGYNVFDPSVRPCVIICCLQIAPTFVDGYTQNFGKLSVMVKAWMGLIFRKVCQGDHFLGRETCSICVIICCRLDSAYICWCIYTKLWEVVSNSKSMDGIDFQKTLSRGSLFGWGT